MMISDNIAGEDAVGRQASTNRRRFGMEKQISFRSEAMIVARLNLAAAKLAVRMDYDGAPLKTGHVVNALAHWVGNMPDDQLAKVCAPLLRDLEQYMEGVDAQPARHAHGAPPRDADEKPKKKLA